MAALCGWDFCFGPETEPSTRVFVAGCTSRFSRSSRELRFYGCPWAPKFGGPSYHPPPPSQVPPVRSPELGVRLGNRGADQRSVGQPAPRPALRLGYGSSGKWTAGFFSAKSILPGQAILGTNFGKICQGKPFLGTYFGKFSTLLAWKSYYCPCGKPLIVHFHVGWKEGSFPYVTWVVGQGLGVRQLGSG